MLNLSPDNKVYLNEENLTSLQLVTQEKSSNKLMRILYVLFGLLFLALFLPWTQNISSKGKLITLRPEQRPQTINTIIAGRIEKWYVQEGQRVKKGDTMLFISEVKEDYLDPNLVPRTDDQILSKEKGIGSNNSRE